jgi:hypothetical protein
MPKKFKAPTLIQTQKINERIKKYSKDQIKKKLEGRRNRVFTTEQKLLILKLLQLNDMDYTQTVKDASMSSRPAIYKWEKEYGKLVFAHDPGVVTKAIEKIETDLAVLQADTMRKTYRTINKGLDKMDELIDKTTSPRQIYAIKEAILASVEVIKVEKFNLPEQPKVNNYFMAIHELMVNNLPHVKNGDKD